MRGAEERRTERKGRGGVPYSNINDHNYSDIHTAIYTTVVKKSCPIYICNIL